MRGKASCHQGKLGAKGIAVLFLLEEGRALYL